MYKRWSRWAALLLALTLAVGLLPATAAAEGSDEVIIGDSTYNVCLGMESSRRGEVVYRPTSMERGIVSAYEETQWDYYILLYDYNQDIEAPPDIYRAFWDAYTVTVSKDDSTSASVELTELQNASDGYHKYVSVTVTGPWDGRIDGSFTPKDTSSGTDGSFSSDVSIQLAQKLEPDSDASGDYSFSLKNVKPREDRYFYIDLGEAQPVTVSGTLSTKGQINLVQVDSEDNTKTLWIWDDEIHDSSSAEVFGQILLFEVHVREEAELSGTISVEVEQPALLYRNMQYEGEDVYEDTENPPRPLTELNLELGDHRSIRLYYGTTVSSEPVTELTVDGNTLTVEPMKDRDGKTYWELRGVEYGESTLNWTAGSEEGSVDVFVDLPEYAFYSVQRRDVNYYLDEISYSDLPADKTVWLMSKDGFTNEEVEDISVFADNEPINTSAVPRPDNSDRYDIQFVVPEPDAGQGLYVEAMLSGGYIAGCPVSLVQSGSALYLEDYAAGFAWEMGDILMINEGDWQLGWRIPAGDGSYAAFPQNISVTVGEKKTDANGGTYFEVVDNDTVSVSVKRLWVETISGPAEADAFSFDAGSIVTSLDTPTFPVPLYCLDNVDCSAVVKAEVELRVDDNITSGTVSISVWKEVITRTEIVRPENDTTDDLNQYLATLESSEIYTIHLGKEYNGTIELPERFNGELTLSGLDNHTVVRGGINLNGGELSVLQGVSFLAQSDTESALYGGKCTNIYNCFFSGYTVAADATAGMLTFSGGNVFAGNEIAVRMDAAEHSGGANLNAWEKNSFVRNTTAVQVLSFNDLVSPYYFRIVDSNFIGNDTDFDLQAEGTVYLYRNYFGGVHFQAEDMPLAEYLTALINADGTQSLQRLVISNSPNIENGSSAGGKVVTNPRWKYPVEDWWKLTTSIDELFGAGGALAVQADEESYENYLTSDWELVTQIVNEEAGELLLDDAAFNEAVGEKQVDVVDQNENPLGTWTFD